VIPGGTFLDLQCFAIERSIVFKTMDRQCESFSRIFSSATGLDKSFMFIRNTWTSSSISENSEIFKKKNFGRGDNKLAIPEYTVYKYFIIPKNIRLIVEWSPQNDKDQ
jgi:hypothetical protein